MPEEPSNTQDRARGSAVQREEVRQLGRSREVFLEEASRKVFLVEASREVFLVEEAQPQEVLARL